MEHLASPVKQIFTIGHSTRPWQEFVELLQAHEIEAIADVRRFPGSRRYPHFTVPTFSENLRKSGIAYHHFPELGGRRKPRPDSPNTQWREEGFRGFADYMETAEYQGGINRLLGIAATANIAITCAEAVWWRCHRGLISDYLMKRGIPVLHIVSKKKPELHPYTTPARQLMLGEAS
jgi:uncharacterized protein (DUF488 family)